VRPTSIASRPCENRVTQPLKNKPLKIALVSNLYSPNVVGGAELVAQDVAEGLVRRGHSVSVITLHRGARAQAAMLNGVQVHYRPLHNLYWPFPVSPAGTAGKAAWHLIDAYNPASGGAFGRLLDEIRPDVVNTHNIAGFSVAIWKAIKRRGLPLVHTLHDHYLLCPYSTMFKNGRNCTRQCLGCRLAAAPRARMTRLVDVAIGVSRYILERHRARGLFALSECRVVYSGCRPAAPDAGQPASDSRALLRIGFLGALSPHKGVERLLEAFLILPAGTAQLRIAGSGEPAYVAHLKQRALGRDDISWLGFVGPETYLPQLDVLVVPSLVNEAMGRVVLEAFSSGVPVLAADRGGIPELIDERCGRLFDPDDAPSLARLLEELVAQPQRLAPMRQAARARARDFSADAMLSGYLAAYAQALERARRPSG
jgi:glycosyltransferase involved in cell wall biosynthesis